ncbi:MAG TPA: phospholipase D-like domain-containing protein [Marmoricola sp.]|nr:phospholipase D-like domain-containing protein [Marmoricola sp.]
MPRSHTSRPGGGALVAITLLVLSLLAGAFAGAAQADDPPSPSATPTTAAPDAGGTDGKLAETLLGNGPEPAPENWVVRRGVSSTVNVAMNDDCSPNPADTCAYSKGSYVPSKWSFSISSAGVMTFKAPSDARPGRYHLYYKVTNTKDASLTAESYVSVAITPDSYTAPTGVTFSHPYRKHYKYKIRDRIVRAINSVPSGARIQMASWSFASRTYTRALKNAKNRGVTVQIILSARNKRSNSDYRTLRDFFGTSVTSSGSWVKKCSYSCRGVGGTMHSKIFLFSQVYRTPSVMMSGSANLTDFAVSNQWNQMSTVSGNKPVYSDAVTIFWQMAADRKANPVYVEKTYPTLTNYYYPTTSVITSTDFMYKALNRVQCTGAANTSDGRTVIKIAMYAWYQDRGKWLAKRVRYLWEHGCKIRIVYAISSNPVKKVLYSPAGRGRIPMRQILLTNTEGTPIYYLHDKWVAIRGHYGTNTRAWMAFQGSFNFSDLGFYSDENFQMLPGYSTYTNFAKDFDLLWKDKQARAPSPISKIPTIDGRYSQDDLRLGTGVYRYMEAD